MQVRPLVVALAVAKLVEHLSVAVERARTWLSTFRHQSVHVCAGLKCDHFGRPGEARYRDDASSLLRVSSEHQDALVHAPLAAFPERCSKVLLEDLPRAGLRQRVGSYVH